MSVGFRKSLFGFNCDDVIEYVQNTHKKFSDKENALNDKIACLDKTIATINAQLEDVKAAKAAVEAQLKEYTDKYDEIERLSQNIGKLYLVAQANAKSIMQNSAENRDIANREVEKNLHFAHRDGGPGRQNRFSYPRQRSGRAGSGSGGQRGRCAGQSRLPRGHCGLRHRHHHDRDG